jgi:hypothetical protein
MRKLVAVALCLCMATAAAQTVVEQLLMPSPWTIGIALVEILQKEKRKIVYIEVTAQGRDLKDAQEQALRMAVERAVGAVVSSSSESRDSKLVRDEIIVYASGYVDDYKLVAQRTANNQTQVQMKVWVSHNKLANRLLGESRADGAVEGNRITEQIKSFKRERQTGDQLLTTVLRDFPGRSFDVRMEKTRVRVDKERATWIDVNISVTWDSNYIKGLQEVMRTIQHRNDCDSFWTDCDAVSIVEIGRERSGFDDVKAIKIMWDQMVVSRPMLQLSLLDNGRAVQYQECFRIADLDSIEHARGFVHYHNSTIKIDPSRRERISLSVPSSQLPTESLDQARVEIVRMSECARIRR